MRMTLLPRRFSGNALNFMATPRSRIRVVGSIKVLPIYRFLIRPSLYSIPLWRENPTAAGIDESGTGIMTSASINDSRANCSPMR